VVGGCESVFCCLYLELVLVISIDYLVHNMLLKLMVNHLLQYKPINAHDSLDLQ